MMRFRGVPLRLGPALRGLSTDAPAVPEAPVPPAPVTPPTPPPPRSARRTWLTRGVLATLGVVAVGLFHQYGYAKKLRSYKDTLALVQECDAVTRHTGDLEPMRWWDVRGFVLAWEWRPRVWWR